MHPQRLCIYISTSHSCQSNWDLYLFLLTSIWRGSINISYFLYVKTWTYFIMPFHMDKYTHLGCYTNVLTVVTSWFLQVFTVLNDGIQKQTIHRARLFLFLYPCLWDISRSINREFCVRAEWVALKSMWLPVRICTLKLIPIIFTGRRGVANRPGSYQWILFDFIHLCVICSFSSTEPMYMKQQEGEQTKITDWNKTHCKHGK